MIVDGAHAPGQIDLDLNSLGIDIYTGACHKWMLCPKGVSFLYASKKIQEQLDPLVVSWGWESEDPGDSQFIDYHQYQGTNDPASYLSVPRAIQFLNDNNWIEVRAHCHEMVVKARDMLINTAQTQRLCPNESLGQMASVELNLSLIHI